MTAALGGLFSAAGVEPLEQWEMILESRGEHFYELAAGPGENGRTYIVATTSKGSILTWPQDEPSAVTRITLPTVASTVAWANGRFVVGGPL